MCLGVFDVCHNPLRGVLSLCTNAGQVGCPTSTLATHGMTVSTTIGRKNTLSRSDESGIACCIHRC